VKDLPMPFCGGSTLAFLMRPLVRSSLAAEFGWPSGGTAIAALVWGGEQRQALVRPVSKSREMPHWDHSGERQFSSIGGWYPMRVDSSPEITIPETTRPNIPARRVGRESRSQTFFQTNPICNARALDRLESLSSGHGDISHG
jgi:hypothetical protein